MFGRLQDQALVLLVGVLPGRDAEGPPLHQRLQPRRETGQELDQVFFLHCEKILDIMFPFQE